MTEYLAPLETLIEQFRKLPGIGRKSAVRMAFAVLDLPDETVEGFSEALLGAKRKIRHCAVCHNFSVDEICPICADSTRDTSLICVVEDAKAVLAFGRSAASAAFTMYSAALFRRSTVSRRTSCILPILRSASKTASAR